MPIDPFSLALAGLVVYNVITISMGKIEKWVRSKQRLSPQHAAAIGIIIAQKMNERLYVDLPVEINPRANTQIVKVLYDERTETVYEAEAVKSWKAPTRDFRRAIEENDGMVIIR